MAFKESPRFPESISFGAQGGPAFLTDVVTLTSGSEQRNEEWLSSRQEYDVSTGVKTEAQFKIFDAFFRVVGGRRDGFRFKDWADYKVATGEGVAELVSGNTFQLQKKYTSGADITLRDIRKPVGAIVLKDGATTLNAPGDYTLDATTGQVTTTAPHSASNLNWTGQFDVPVRFDVDKLQAAIQNKNQIEGFLIVWDAIPLIELPPGDDV